MVCIAIIDADAQAVEPLAQAIAAQGDQTLRITDAAEALDTIRRQRPQALIVCVEMPHISGYTLCNKLKRDTELARIPLLLVSAHASQETFDEHRRLRTRADAYGHKPYDADEVQRALQPLLHPAGAAPHNNDKPLSRPPEFHDREGQSSPPPGGVSPKAAAASPHTPGADGVIFTRPTTPRASQTPRLGEDPSVRDISQAPFFQTARDGRNADGPDVGDPNADAGDMAAAAAPHLAAQRDASRQAASSPTSADLDPRRPSERPTVAMGDPPPDAASPEEQFLAEAPPAFGPDHEPLGENEQGFVPSFESSAEAGSEAESLLEEAIDLGAQTREFKAAQLQRPSIGRSGAPGLSEQQRWVEQALSGLDDPSQAQLTPDRVGDPSHGERGAGASSDAAEHSEHPAEGERAPDASALRDASLRNEASGAPSQLVLGDTQSLVAPPHAGQQQASPTMSAQDRQAIVDHLQALEQALTEANAAHRRAQRLLDSLSTAMGPLLGE